MFSPQPPLPSSLGSVPAWKLSKLLATGIWVGLALLLMTPLLVFPGTLYPDLFPKAVYARVFILLIVGLWAALLLWDRSYRPPRSLAVLVFSLYVAAVFLSAVAGVSRSHSLWSSYERMVGAWDLALWFLLAAATVSMLRSPGAGRALLNWSLAVALVLCLLAVGQAYGLTVAPYTEPTCRVMASLGNPSYLAAILVVSTMVSMGLLVRSFPLSDDDGKGQSPTFPRPLASLRARLPSLIRPLTGRPGWANHLMRAFWLATAFLSIWVLFQTGTRGALVGLAAGALAAPVALVVWGNRRAARPLALGAGGVFLVVAALFVVAQTVGFPGASACRGESAASRFTTFVTTAVSERTVAGSQYAARMDYAEIGLKAFLDRPLLGWGHANYEQVFQRYAEASMYRHTPAKADLAHNQVIEELATHGVVGALLYFALWLALVWTVVRRRRAPRDEVLAYAVLGGLTGYFTQNLFLFDTPGSILFWIIMVAWVAGLDHQQAPATRASAGGLEAVHPPSSVIGMPTGDRSAPVGLWARRAATIAIIPALGFSLYYLTYLPSAANRTFLQAYRSSQPVAERMAMARKSFDTQPDLANPPREIMFDQLILKWDQLSPGEQQAIALFVLEETQRSLEIDPRNVEVVWRGLSILQRSLGRENLDLLDSYVLHLQENAPQRIFTHLVSAKQQAIKGNYREAIRITEEWKTLSPNTAYTFRDIRQIAEDGLRSEEEPVTR